MSEFLNWMYYFVHFQANEKSNMPLYVPGILGMFE